MADIDYAGTLRRIADEIDEAGKFGSATVLREAAALIERLTPKPMTWDEVAKVLNDENHLYTSRWLMEGSLFVSEQGHLTAFEAEAIARAYVAKKEAARA